MSVGNKAKGWSCVIRQYYGVCGQYVGIGLIPITVETFRGSISVKGATTLFLEKGWDMVNVL